jgi:hypothetical protein
LGSSGIVGPAARTPEDGVLRRIQTRKTPGEHLLRPIMLMCYNASERDVDLKMRPTPE